MKEKKRKSSIPVNTAAIVIFVILVIAGILIYLSGDKKGDYDTYEIIYGVGGDYNSQKVEVLEIFDFMCPHCYEFYKTGTLSRLKEKYGDRIEIRYVAIHFIEDRNAPRDTAILPVLAYEYAKDEGKGEEMMSALFQAYSEGQLNITDLNDLEKISKDIGLDTQDFLSRLFAYEGRVNVSDEIAFNTYKIKIVPTIVIAKNLNVSSATFSTFENMDKVIGSILGGIFKPI